MPVDPAQYIEPTRFVRFQTHLCPDLCTYTCVRSINGSIKYDYEFTQTTQLLDARRDRGSARGRTGEEGEESGGRSSFRLVEEQVLGSPKSAVSANYSDSNHEGGDEYGSDAGEEEHDDAGEDKEA